MPAIDKIHNAVRNALIKDGWTITHDPYVIRFEEVTLFADLAAERTLAVEREGRKIVVEIKSFGGASPIQDLKVMLGQYDLYRGFLEIIDPNRQLYLAISETSYQNLFSQRAIQMIMQRYQLPLIIVRLTTEEIIAWIPRPTAP
ncbi:MAG: element excision factor XisH family protein [Chloroflexaceae bacterium]